MANKFIMTRDINGYNGFGIPFPDTEINFYTTLASNVAQSVTVPSFYENWIMILTTSSGVDIWVANNTTATVPGSSFENTASVLNPIGRQVKSGDVISFVTAGTTNPGVNVTFMAITPYTN